MLFLLDTNAVADAIEEHPRLAARLSSILAPDAVAICTIVRGEVLFGIERLAQGKKRRKLEGKANKILSGLVCYAVPAQAGDQYAVVKQSCRAKGTPLDENDLWIAATALVLGSTIVTRDADFQRVDGLSLVDWTK